MTRSLLLALLISVVAGHALAQDADANKQKVTERGKRDIALILPQLGLGGEETDTLNALKFSTKDWTPADAEAPDPIAATWCVPNGVDKSTKMALLIALHGDGGNGKNMARSCARVSTKADPVFVAGVSWQNAQRALRGGGVPGFVAQVREMMTAISEEYSIDPDRIFMMGFSAGCTVTEFFLVEEWASNPERMDVRAAFFASKAFDYRKAYPPIPMVQTVGENEDNFAGQDQRGYIRKFCCGARIAGLGVTYHEIPGKGHELAPRVMQIVRDHINAFGGPGCDIYRTAKGKQQPAPALPFESEDPFVKELIAMCKGNDWSGALARVTELSGDKSIKTKLKRAAKKFPKEMEKFAKKALPDLEELIEQAMEAEKFPPAWAVERLRTLCETYAEETWVSKRSYAELLGKLDTEFEPAKRERERAELFRKAEELERDQTTWGEAKKLYEELAKRADEDDGASVWPKAAKYRLQWWVG